MLFVPTFRFDASAGLARRSAQSIFQVGLPRTHVNCHMGLFFAVCDACMCDRPPDSLTSFLRLVVSIGVDCQSVQSAFRCVRRTHAHFAAHMVCMCSDVRWGWHSRYVCVRLAPSLSYIVFKLVRPTMALCGRGEGEAWRAGRQRGCPPGGGPKGVGDVAVWCSRRLSGVWHVGGWVGVSE